MSAITFEQVKHLASLALIEMTDEELTAMASELDVIVASVETMSQKATADIPATSHPIPSRTSSAKTYPSPPSPRKRRSPAPPTHRTASSACRQSSTKTKRRTTK